MPRSAQSSERADDALHRFTRFDTARRRQNPRWCIFGPCRDFWTHYLGRQDNGGRSSRSTPPDNCCLAGTCSVQKYWITESLGYWYGHAMKSTTAMLHGNILLLSLLAAVSDLLHIQPLVEAQRLVDLVQPGGRHNPLQQPIQTKPSKQLVQKVQHAREQERNTADDLREGFWGGRQRLLSSEDGNRVLTAEGVEQGSEVLLRFRECVELALGPIDGAADLLDEDLERLREPLLLWRCAMALLVALRAAGDLAVRVRTLTRRKRMSTFDDNESFASLTLDCALRLVEDLFGLFEQRLHLLHELVLVAIFFLLCVHVLDVLSSCKVG